MGSQLKCKYIQEFSSALEQPTVNLIIFIASETPIQKSQTFSHSDKRSKQYQLASSKKWPSSSNEKQAVKQSQPQAIS